MTGSGMATSSRNAISMMISAATTAMISLARVLGLEICCPRYPPAETWIPAGSAAFLAVSRMLSPWASVRSPDETFRAAEM